jgi:hypothetical protein
MTEGALVTKRQLLKKLGLTQPELDDLLVKFGDFQKRLSPKQTKVVSVRFQHCLKQPHG